MTDADIVKFIADNELRNCDRAIEIIYRRHYYMVETMVVTNSGTKDDARDVFQECMIAFYKNIKAGKYTMDSRISTYLFAVSKNQWLKRLRVSSKNRTVEIAQIDQVMHEDDHLTKMEFTEKQMLIGNLLQTAGEKCKKLLQLVYYEKLKMEKIATVLSFKSAQEARNQKLKCMRKLKAIVKDNDFYNINLKT